MRSRIYAASVALGALLAIPAVAAPHEKCDSDGCWTYDCDATSNHCHRHWISSSKASQAGFVTDTTIKPATPPADQMCDANGENCQPLPPPQ